MQIATGSHTQCHKVPLRPKSEHSRSSLPISLTHLVVANRVNESGLWWPMGERRLDNLEWTDQEVTFQIRRVIHLVVPH